MREGEPREQITSARGHRQRDLAPVACAPRTTDEAALGRATGKLHRAVVLDRQTRGERADGRRPFGAEPADGQEELVLLRLDAGGPGRLLAEIEEPTDDEPDLRQR